MAGRLLGLKAQASGVRPGHSRRLGRGVCSAVASRVLSLAIASWGVGVLGCQPPVAPPEPTPPRQDPIDDREGPNITTDPITAPQPSDRPIVFEARASDPSGVYQVVLNFKPSNTDWQQARLEPDSEDPEFFWLELLPERFEGASSLAYYLEASDGTAYHTVRSSPSTGQEAPYVFNLSGSF